MKNVVRYVGAGLIGATAIGFAGAAAAPAASAASASTMGATKAVADYTRGFNIVNMTNTTMTLVGINNAEARDGYAPIGTTIAPGETYHYEKVFYFGLDRSTGLEFQWQKQHGHEVKVGVVDVKMTIDGVFGTTWMTLDHRGNFDAEVQDAGTRLLLMDKDMSTVEVPAADAQAQADLLNRTCVSGLASCTFVPTARTAGTPIRELAAGGANNTSSPRTVVFTTKTTVGSSQSVEISGSAKLTIDKIFEVGMTQKYGSTYTMSKEVTQTHTFTMPAYTYVDFIARTPTEKVTGDFTVILGKTTWKLRGVTFTLPTKSGTVLYDSAERPLTPTERAALPEAAKIDPVS